MQSCISLYPLLVLIIDWFIVFANQTQVYADLKYLLLQRVTRSSWKEGYDLRITVPKYTHYYVIWALTFVIKKNKNKNKNKNETK